MFDDIQNNEIDKEVEPQNENSTSVVDDLESNVKNNDEVLNDESQKGESNVSSRKKGLFERLLHRKISDSSPTITKGKKSEYVHKTFTRKKDEEPDPSTFPKKKRIISWQEEEMIMVDGLEVDFELTEEMAELAERKD